MVDRYMEARTQGIGELIEQRRLFQVPDHQRDYAWHADDEVAQFLDDIVRAVRDGAPEYFLGLIVLVDPEEGASWEILDGQQRLATTTMVLAAIREWLHAAGRSRDADLIQATYIGVSTLGEPEDRPRITLNINDRAAFRDLVVNRYNDQTLEGRRDAAPRLGSVRRLIEAALLARISIRQVAAAEGPDPDDQARLLFALAHYLRDNAKVVVMSVASSANAYMIFESLNDRGLDLSVLDLVKNHLFSRAGSRLPEVQHHWATMQANLGDRAADDFLKVYWTSQFGRIQRGRLFQEWRLRHDGLAGEGSVALSSELAAAADRFAALDMPDHETWDDIGAEGRRLVRSLTVLGNQQVRPAILAGLKKFDSRGLRRLLTHLYVLIVRYQTVGKGRTGLLEILGARVARGIASGELSTPQRVWRELSSHVSSDEDFRRDFETYTETKAARARLVLTELERVARASGAGVDTDLYPDEALTLEHILPRNPTGGEWTPELTADPELRDQATKLGNMCLVAETSNRTGGSKNFSYKRANVYSRSELMLTRSLSEYDSWNRDSIRSRQEGMASLAVRAFPRPSD